MSAKVWMSGLLSNYDVGMKQGIRAKFFSHDWEPASFDLELVPDEVYESHRRYLKGHSLTPRDFPEAGAVWDQHQFGKVRDVLMVGPFYVVRGKLTKIFSEADLGDGGLVPCTMLQEDLRTPLGEDYYFLNIGSIKNSIDISRCEDAKKLAVDKKSGNAIFKLNRTIRNGRVVLTDAALDGADLWVEKAVTRELFMSDKLARQIIECGFSEIFDLQECQISGGTVVPERGI